MDSETHNRRPTGFSGRPAGWIVYRKWSEGWIVPEIVEEIEQWFILGLFVKV